MSATQTSQLRAPTAPVFPAAARLPLVGLGTWTQLERGEVEDAVKTAIRLFGGVQAPDLLPRPLHLGRAPPLHRLPASQHFLCCNNKLLSATSY